MAEYGSYGAVWTAGTSGNSPVGRDAQSRIIGGVGVRSSGQRSVEQGWEQALSLPKLPSPALRLAPALPEQGLQYNPPVRTATIGSARAEPPSTSAFGRSRDLRDHDRFRTEFSQHTQGLTSGAENHPALAGRRKAPEADFGIAPQTSPPINGGYQAPEPVQAETFSVDAVRSSGALPARAPTSPSLPIAGVFEQQPTALPFGPGISSQSGGASSPGGAYTPAQFFGRYLENLNVTDLWGNKQTTDGFTGTIDYSQLQ